MGYFWERILGEGEGRPFGDSQIDLSGYAYGKGCASVEICQADLLGPGDGLR